MTILCQKKGILTTIQDIGRFGYRRFGINPTGVMDTAAARLINILLGNDQYDAVLEIHFPAGEYLFENDVVFAIGGADFNAELNGVGLRNWKIHHAARGSVFQFKKRASGNRSYLAVKGGFAVDKWLGSSSTNLAAHCGGFQGRSIKKGDSIPLHLKSIANAERELSLAASIIPYYRSIPAVRIIAGAEFESLAAVSQENLLKRNFEVSADSNRMGFRLKGEPLYRMSLGEIISSAVSFGTIQLLPNSQMIVLMADHQTSGGYPRIGHVITRDLPLLAQLGSGDKVGFQLVSIYEAESLLEEFENDLQMLKVGVRLANLQ